jgi:pyrroline-5-carboxylate reductase
MARAALRAGVVSPDSLRLVTRSGRASGFEAWPAVRASDDPGTLDACDLVLLAVPPAALPAVRPVPGDGAVVSVVAGATIARVQAATGTRRVLRAMSSPAAEQGLAFSAVCAAGDVTEADRDRTARLLAACGAVETVGDERLIDVFTALTGPVPGFVAYFAEAMAAFAVAEGVPAAVADRAVRQLFLASGRALAEEAATPAGQVQAMVDYAGTTAAGLVALRRSAVANEVAAALGAAMARARSIVPD